ncbi:PepSY domain-containing protein [Allosphingosinicella vermicomposti]|uniref:PepSY domain-containing protein n=1 Tax=Allosphingosinicella vermicomposti TaxID=614671 RepID=UPI000D0EA9B0|nr:PepSY domain-containing protein [Allosphingosinicella vermicomposti]
MTIRWPLLVRRVHKWLALFVGIQVVLWTITGFYMVSVHIDYIHGDHLVKAPEARGFDLARLVPAEQVVAAHPQTQELRLQHWLDRPVWRVQTTEGRYLVDGQSGQKLPTLTQAQAEASARSVYTGNPTIVSSKLLMEPPLEMQSAKPPFWQIEFEGWNRPTLYISPTTGELISRRHALWRVFDFAWMLHIMDYDERSNVNNPLLRVATWSAVIMALSGAWLLLWSFPRKKRKKA